MGITLSAGGRSSRRDVAAGPLHVEATSVDFVGDECSEGLTVGPVVEDGLDGVVEFDGPMSHKGSEGEWRGEHTAFLAEPRGESIALALLRTGYRRNRSSHHFARYAPCSMLA